MSINIDYIFSKAILNNPGKSLLSLTRILSIPNKHSNKLSDPYFKRTIATLFRQIISNGTRYRIIGLTNLLIYLQTILTTPEIVHLLYTNLYRTCNEQVPVNVNIHIKIAYAVVYNNRDVLLNIPIHELKTHINQYGEYSKMYNIFNIVSELKNGFYAYHNKLPNRIKNKHRSLTLWGGPNRKNNPSLYYLPNNIKYKISSNISNARLGCSQRFRCNHNESTKFP